MAWSGRLLAPAALDRLRRDYFGDGAAEVEGTPVYADAGAGDFGLGGILIDAPERGIRVVIATNTYEVFDIEELASDLALLLLEDE